MSNLTCFNVYEINGKLGAELNEDIVYSSSHACMQSLDYKRIVIGDYMPLSTADLKKKLSNSLMNAGCDVIVLGMTGIEEVYLDSFHLDLGGAIEVKASHNSGDYNGVKLVLNTGNSAAGHVIEAVEKSRQALGARLECMKVNYEDDGTSCNGIYKPSFPENYAITADAVKIHSAYMGLAKYGDFDSYVLFNFESEA